MRPDSLRGTPSEPAGVTAYGYGRRNGHERLADVHTAIGPMELARRSRLEAWAAQRGM
jgi:hypothetical protein